MNLAQLIDSQRRAGAGSLREMERRAAAAGTPISHSTIGQYANGKHPAFPDEAQRRALANAIGATFEEVTQAALESVTPDADNARMQRAEAWLRLTDGRSEAEVAHLLTVVRAVLNLEDDPERSNARSQ